MVDVNHRKKSPWDPKVEVVANRLKSWKNRYVSLGDRVVLINSVLILSLSFTYLSSRCWFQFLKKLVRIQRGSFEVGHPVGRKFLGNKNPLINTMRVKRSTKNVEVPTRFSYSKITNKHQAQTLWRQHK